MLALICTLVGLLGSESDPRPQFVPLPSFGLFAPFSAGTVYFAYGESADGRYLIRNAWDPANTTLEFYGMPVSVDTWTGALARLDLTNDGEVPHHWGNSFDQNVYAMTADTRFILFRSDSPSYGPLTYPQINPLYWLDRDSDEDGIFDELDARRVVRIGGDGDKHYEFGHAAISEDGRYVAFDDWTTSPIEPHQVFAIYLADLDADADGVLGEEADVDLRVVSGSPIGAEHSVSSYRPSMSADGRFIAWSSHEASLFLGYQWDGYFMVPIFDDPPGYPHVVQVTVLDRDEDGDGIFDESLEPKKIDVTAQIGMQDVIGPVFVELPRNRSELLFTSPHRSSLDSDQYSLRLLAYDFESNRVTQLVPTASGIGFGRMGLNVRFGSSPDGRRVHFNTTEVPEGGLICPEYADSLVVLDRDADEDEVLDELGGTAAEFITSPSIPKAAVQSASPDLDRFLCSVAVYSCPGRSSMYGMYRYDASCHGSITDEKPLFPEWPTQELVRLSVFGCPQSEGHLLFEVEMGAPAPSVAWLAIHSTEPTGVNLLGNESTVFVPIQLDHERLGMNERGTIGLQLPKHFPAMSFMVNAFVVSDSSGQIQESRRVRIQTP